MPPLYRTARLCYGRAVLDEFASTDGCIAPTPGSLRSRLDQGDTFTMGDAHPFAEATRSQWAMPPLNGSARLYRGPAIPDEFASPDGCIAPTPGSLRPRLDQGDTFTMGDAHPFAEATRSQWAMPLLNRTARLCRGPVIPDEFASPDGCIAPTPDSLRPRLDQSNTFTIGDASLKPDGPPLPRPSHPGLILLRPTDASPLRLVRCARALTKATRSQWAMHVHAPRPIRSLWAMPLLNRSARLCRGPDIPV